MFEQIVIALAALTIVIAPLAILAVLSLRFGVDTRPSIGDRDQRAWI